MTFPAFTPGEPVTVAYMGRWLVWFAGDWAEQKMFSDATFVNTVARKFPWMPLRELEMAVTWFRLATTGRALA